MGAPREQPDAGDLAVLARFTGLPHVAAPYQEPVPPHYPAPRLGSIQDSAGLGAVYSYGQAYLVLQYTACTICSTIWSGLNVEMTFSSPEHSILWEIYSHSFDLAAGLAFDQTDIFIDAVTSEGHFRL